MIWARRHLSACISGNNSVKPQLIFINRQYNHTRSCVMNIIARALIHSRPTRQWPGGSHTKLFSRVIFPFFRAEQEKNKIHNVFMTWQMGRKVGPRATKYLGAQGNSVDSLQPTELVVKKRWENGRQ